MNKYDIGNVSGTPLVRPPEFGVEFKTIMPRFTLPYGLSRRVGLSTGLPLKRGFTVCLTKYFQWLFTGT